MGADGRLLVDCCAEIKNERILLWDEDLPKDNYSPRRS